MQIRQNLNQYWCFICENKFSSNSKAKECPNCHEQAFQQFTPNNNPNQFQVYRHQTNPVNNRPQPTIQSSFFPRTTISVTMIGPNGITYSNTSNNIVESFTRIQQLLRQLLQSGVQHQAATPQQIAKLKKIEKVKQCSICQQEDLENQGGFQLNCSHEFHKQCIDQWFKRANTCPVCRKKLQ